MFQMIVVVMFTLSGSPTGPTMKADHPTEFSTMDECKAFALSYKGKRDVDLLADLIRNSSLPEGVGFSLSVGCVAKEDNSI